MGIFDVDEIITTYSLKEAIKDGVLIQILKSEWSKAGKPIVATANVLENIKRAKRRMVWDEFAHWNRYVKDTLDEEEKLFAMEVDQRTVWVIEETVAFILMYPEEY